jgi:uncharacterized protein
MPSPPDPSYSAEQIAAKNAVIITQVEQWLDQVVIGLNLCPFAAEPRKHQKIRITLSTATNPRKNPTDLLADLQAELCLLSQTPATDLETSLLIIPHGLEDFDDYNDFLYLADRLLKHFGWEGEFQIASFHPHYQFADTQPDDAENLTNRSPYPLLHILREASIETALAHYPNPETIPQRNIEQVRNLSKVQRQQLFPRLFKK